LDFTAGRSKCAKAIRGYSVEAAATRGDSSNYQNLTNLTKARKGQRGKRRPEEYRGDEEGRAGSSRENLSMVGGGSPTVPSSG